MHVYSAVSICMVERPTETGSLSRAQARLYHQKGSRKKAQAAGQKSRAFAMRAKLRWPRQRHSYAESTEDYILDESGQDQTTPSSNLVSHFVSTRDISTYYDGTEYRTITANEILHSKREEIFNAYKHASGYRNSEVMGGSVRHLPVSTKEFGFMNDIIQEELDVTEQSERTEREKNKENERNLAEAAKLDASKNNPVHRQPSEASSSSSGGTRYSPSTLNESTWSIGGDLSNQGRQRKPSLRKRIQSAFSFQNIRKAMSMEKLDEDEKQRSMSHHYLNENEAQHLGARERSATLQERSSNGNSAGNHHEPLRKAPSISSLISSVRMRKRQSRMRADKRNRHTIADPESYAKGSENANKSKKFSNRPVSAVLSSTNRRRLEDVGNPSFFRPIGRVLQMNPVEGTLLVEMVKPSSGPFGFYIARKKESGDLGSVYISRLSDSYPDKMFAGLMRTGDEITEVNGTSVSGLTLDQVYDLILDSDKTLLKLKPAQVHIV